MENALVIDTVCPACDRRFRLRPEAMGKKVKCHCGEAFIAKATPNQREAAIIEDDLAMEAGPADSDAGQATARQMPPAAMPRSYSPVAMALMAREDDSTVSMLREKWLPAGLLAAGYALHLVLWSLWLPSITAVLIVAAFGLAVQLFIFIPVMFSSLTMGAKWLDISPGPMRSVAWKMLALTLGPAAVADVLFTATLILAHFDWEIVVGGFGFYLVLMGVSAAIVFELNVAQTAFLVLINFIARIAAGYPAALMLSNLKWID